MLLGGAPSSYFQAGVRRTRGEGWSASLELTRAHRSLNGYAQVATNVLSGDLLFSRSKRIGPSQSEEEIFVEYDSAVLVFVSDK